MYQQSMVCVETKLNLSLYSSCCAEACNELAVPISVS